MPIGPVQDESLFPLLNGALIGYVLLVFFPRWKFTSFITLFLPVIYSALYASLAVNYFLTNMNPVTIDFSSVAGVIQLFQVPEIVMAGWVHYVAFDLIVARYIVIDAHAESISHLLIVPLIPVTLMAGPVGFLLYTTLKISKPIREVVFASVDSILYSIVSCLSAFMAVWIFVGPASIYLALGTERSTNAHLANMHALWESTAIPTPLSITSKYYGQKLVVLTHQLPAGIWSLSLPIQLSSRVRRMYPWLHRMTGYVFLCTVPLITAGVYIIAYKKLTFDYSFPDLMASTRGFSELGLSPFENSIFVMKLFFYILAAYFTLTALLALRFALRGQYAAHRAWMVRHAASGIWVAVQRLYVGARGAARPAAQRAAFYDGAVVAVVAVVGLAELYLRLGAHTEILRGHRKQERKTQ